MRELVTRIATDTGSMTLGEKLFGGVLVSIFSMLMVFAVLVVLMAVIRVLGQLLGARPVSKRQEEESVVTANAAAAPAQEAQQNAMQEEEIVAAIVAALQSQRRSSGSKLVIKRLEPTEGAWSAQGLIEQVNARLS